MILTSEYSFCGMVPGKRSICLLQNMVVITQ
jgi:hypothetical protein